MSVLECVPEGPAVPEMVDLGLPSGLKWASFNLGATKPEENGGYYQLGGLEDVTDTGIYLDWDNCPYHIGASPYTGWTKYVTSDCQSYWSGDGSPDNKTALDPDDDVAHVKLGGKWRMPAKEEFDELISNSTGIWSTALGSTRSGFENAPWDSTDRGMDLESYFTSGIECWYPASGYLYDIDGSLVDVGSLGEYWSCSTYKFCGAFLDIRDNRRIYPYPISGRANGLSVRCCRE